MIVEQSVINNTLVDLDTSPPQPTDHGSSFPAAASSSSFWIRTLRTPNASSCSPMCFSRFCVNATNAG